MKLHRDLKVTQKTAWFMLHWLREAWDESGLGQFCGPVEVDETYIGGRRANMSKSRRKTLEDQASNKMRAKTVSKTDAETLQGFIVKHADASATVYTDDAAAYASLPFDYEAVRHSVGEYVRKQVHTNPVGITPSLHPRLP